MRRFVKLLAAAVIAIAAVVTVALGAAKPTVVTGGTSSVTDTGADLHGMVNPNGADTTYYFEWGRTTGYGGKGSVKSAGSGTAGVAAEETADHLTPGATYHYRLVATNTSGTTFGVDRTFVAGHSPAVTTGTVTALGASGAILTGTISPDGERTSWFFQWGSSSSRSQETKPQSLSATSSPQNVAWSLEGLLNPGTVYRYRLVAVHPHGVRTYGTTETFMTYPSVRPYATVRAITAPRHRLRYPYTFSTTGTIGGPDWIPAQIACVGEVTLRFYRDGRQVRFETAPVQSNCTYAATSVFYHMPGGAPGPARLRVVVHFLSTPYLANGRPAHDRVTIR